MANYRAENAIWDTMEWPDFASMSREKLRAYLRELQVRYDGQQKIVQDCLDNMRKQIQKLLRDERLSEGFFQKQLLTLEGVSMTGHAVQSQLERILKAYELTLQKLELDLARVEAEQKNLENLLLDYVKNVHEELGKMDRNSSINIRGKSIKMLRIDLMDWEQELEYYKRPYGGVSWGAYQEWSRNSGTAAVSQGIIGTGGYNQKSIRSDCRLAKYQYSSI